MLGREEKVSQLRLTAVQYVLLGVFLVLAFGLWRLQVARNDYYNTLAEQNRVKQVPILAPRGKILDREGRIIVDNYPSFSALLLRDSRDARGRPCAAADQRTTRAAAVTAPFTAASPPDNTLEDRDGQDCLRSIASLQPCNDAVNCCEALFPVRTFPSLSAHPTET